MIFMKQLDSYLKKGVFSPQSFALSYIWRSSYKAKLCDSAFPSGKYDIHLINMLYV